MTVINEALRLVRVFHNVKQNDLADALGISQSHLSEIEAGKKPVSLELLKKYASHFRLPLSSLIYFAEAKDGLVTRDSNNAIAPKALQMLRWLDIITEEASDADTEKKSAA